MRFTFGASLTAAIARVTVSVSILAPPLPLLPPSVMLAAGCDIAGGVGAPVKLTPLLNDEGVVGNGAGGRSARWLSSDGDAAAAAGGQRRGHRQAGGDAAAACICIAEMTCWRMALFASVTGDAGWDVLMVGASLTAATLTTLVAAVLAARLSLMAKLMARYAGVGSLTCCHRSREQRGLPLRRWRPAGG